MRTSPSRRTGRSDTAASGRDAAGGDPRPDIYVKDLGGVLGVALPPGVARGGSFVLLSPALDPARAPVRGGVLVTTAHELFHLVQFAYMPRNDMPDWVAEGSATGLSLLFAQRNADPEVTRFLGPLRRASADLAHQHGARVHPVLRRRLLVVAAGTRSRQPASALPVGAGRRLPRRPGARRRRRPRPRAPRAVPPQPVRGPRVPVGRALARPRYDLRPPSAPTANPLGPHAPDDQDGSDALAQPPRDPLRPRGGTLRGPPACPRSSTRPTPRPSAHRPGTGRRLGRAVPASDGRNRSAGRVRAVTGVVFADDAERAAGVTLIVTSGDRGRRVAPYRVRLAAAPAGPQC